VQPLIALILAIIGNSIPIVFIILGLNKLVELAEKYSPFLKKMLESIFKRTRRKTWQKLEKYGLIALFIFVAIPLPGTGAWTGSIAAWLFGLPLKKAFWPIFGGVIAAGIIVTILTVGATAVIT
jgi:uncharacterized membrane protein